MSESYPSTTSNGHEINHPREVLSSAELKLMVSEYGLDGVNAQERVEALKNLPPENIALFMADLNKRLQGSDETLVSDRIVKIGDKSTLPVESRYDVFTQLIDKIKNSKNINPARVGDTLALGTVLLHPFSDGNGRTARMLGLIFREDFDEPNFDASFNTLAESRDVARRRGGFMINGYIPYMGEGADQSNPNDVSLYFDKLLSLDASLYTGPYGQVPLKAEVAMVPAGETAHTPEAG